LQFIAKACYDVLKRSWGGVPLEPAPLAWPQRAVAGGSVLAGVVERRVLTLPQVAERLGLCRETARRAVVNGQLPAVKLGGQWLIPLEAVELIEHGQDPRSPS
jgi:excisionase family DNA binding protein